MEFDAKPVKQGKTPPFARVLQEQFVRPGETLATNTRPTTEQVPGLNHVPQRKHKWQEFATIPQTVKEE